MFRNFFGKIFQPHFNKNISLNKQMDLAEQLRKRGEFDKALQIYKKIHQEDASYKPAYGPIVELEEKIKEAKPNQPDSVTTQKPMGK